MDRKLVERLADEFSDVLQHELTPDELAEAVRLNAAEPDVGLVCHTHDHIDANESMAQAFESLMGYDLVGDGGMADADLDLVNAAWALASSRGFRTSAQLTVEGLSLCCPAPI